MFTVLPNTRNANLYLIAALAMLLIAILSFAVIPSIKAPTPELVPVTSISAAPEDFYLRHPDWTGNAQAAVVPVTGISEATDDFYLRHPELRVPAVSAMDTSDYFLRHPELRRK
jgi:hypothetical protein